MPATVALSIVIPVYNGEKTIGDLVRRLSALVIAGGHEIVLVDDGSADNSAAVCHGLVEQARAVAVTFVKLSRNFGEHNAIFAGLNYARGQHIITMDDDFQNPPSEIEKIYSVALDQNKHAVFGYYEKKQHHFLRNVGSRFANWTADRVMDKPKGLYLSTFRCLSRFTVDAILPYRGASPHIDGLVFQVVTNVGAVQVRHDPRATGHSNYTLSKLVRLWMAMVEVSGINPLQPCMAIGGGIGLLAVLGAAVALLDDGASGPVSPLRALLPWVLLILAGLQIVVLGVLGDCVARLARTAAGRPAFVVEKVETSGLDEVRERST